MSIVSIPEKTTNPSDESDFNNLSSAICADIYPRDANGDATSSAGELGTATYPWLSAAVKNGYLAPGVIIPWYDYAGLLDLPQGYMICNGSQITKDNYNEQHKTSVDDTTDYWAQYVGSSELENLYLPGGEARYLMGSTSTLPTGQTTIPEEGAAGSVVSLAHNHGSPVTTGTSPNLLFGNDGGVASTYYSLTNSHTHTFAVPTALTLGIIVEPVSIDVKFLLRIVR